MGRKSNAKKNRTAPSVGQLRRTYLRELPEKLRLEAERKEHDRDQRLAAQLRTEAWHRTFCCWPSPHPSCKGAPFDLGRYCPRRAPWADVLPLCEPMPMQERRARQQEHLDDDMPRRPFVGRRRSALGGLLAAAALGGVLSSPSPGPYRGPRR